MNLEDFNYYKGYYIYYDIPEKDWPSAICVFKRYGWSQESIKDICYIYDVDTEKYKTSEIIFFIKILIDALPEGYEASEVKIWYMDEWINRVRNMMN